MLCISIHKALASLDAVDTRFKVVIGISIHKALASLDRPLSSDIPGSRYFNPQGSREPRLYVAFLAMYGWEFQSTRLSRASTCFLIQNKHTLRISIHKALASLDSTISIGPQRYHNFNPQGSREPRQLQSGYTVLRHQFQSTRLSRASTCKSVSDGSKK